MRDCESPCKCACVGGGGRVIWIPKSSFQHRSYAVMLLIHEMSSQSHDILNVASNTNADPTSKNWGFQHTPPSSSPAQGVYLVHPHTARAILPVQKQLFQWNTTPGCICCSLWSVREEWSPQAASVLIRAHTGRVPIGLAKGNAQVSRFPGRRLQNSFTLRSHWGQDYWDIFSRRPAIGQCQETGFTSIRLTHGPTLLKAMAQYESRSRTHWAHHTLSPRFLDGDLSFILFS